MFQWRVLKQEKKRGLYLFLETLEGRTFLQLGGDRLLETSAMVLQEIFSDTMLNFSNDF
jgi:hypothetical protein